MKSFIASAFGREDVDAIYDDCIRTTLKRLSIKPLRVDRIEHNDDIDKKIIALIEEADLAIVDLTYARPSAYFEAGYAAGLHKPVVYIARGDHFRAKDKDPEGLLRVHFDLQMKNIISWTHPNIAFTKRLESRLRYVTKPLLTAQRKLKAATEERAEFAAMPQQDKQADLGYKARSLLMSRGFKMRKAESRYVPFDDRFTVFRQSEELMEEVSVVCSASVTKTEIARYANFSAMGLRGTRWKKDSIFHLILVTLRPIPASRRTEALPIFRRLDDSTMLNRSRGGRDYRFRDDMYIHFIDGVGSESELAERLRTIIATHGLGRTPERRAVGLTPS